MRFGVTRECFRQNLDRNVPAQLWIEGATHLTHSARADGRKNFVRSQTSPGGQRHVVE